MVFSSIPAYLDPANWQQQPNYNGSSSSNPHQLPNPTQPPPPPPQPHGGGGGAGSIRPGSMADRARMANIPMPETSLQCPRCESTNTKFCYFNNYSLSQPRHFCKTCRRYWTRGGALRSVPVGGGCRRNKRSKGSSSSSSKSPATSGQTASGSTSSTVPSNSTSGAANILGLASQIPQLPFVPHHDIGLNYSGISAPLMGTSEMNFQIGSSNLFGGGGGASLLSSGGVVDQWRLQPPPQQFPNFLGSFDPSSQGLGLYPYQGGGVLESSSGYLGAKLSNSFLSQLASVKMEDNNINQESSLSRSHFLGVNQGNYSTNDQWSSGSAWTDLSGFSSSSTSNPL